MAGAPEKQISSPDVIPLCMVHPPLPPKGPDSLYGGDIVQLEDGTMELISCREGSVAAGNERLRGCVGMVQ